MPVSALIVTLPEDAAERAQALSFLEREPRLTLGDRAGLRIAAVADSASPADDRALFDALQALPGVTLELVAYDFSDLEAAPAACRPERPQGERDGTS